MCFCIYSVEDVPSVPLSDDGADEGASDSWYINSEPEKMQLDGVQELFTEDSPEAESHASGSSGHDAEVDGTSGSAGNDSPNPADSTSTSSDPPRNSGVRTAQLVNQKRSHARKNGKGTVHMEILQ